jgi:hypothetical protein
MAKGTTYPRISKKLWWLLREKFKKAIPTTVSPTLIISLSTMQEQSAKDNVIAPLRELGLIDETGKPTDLAEKWRHDDEYESVCHQIRTNIYPSELIEAYSHPTEAQKISIVNWFAKAGQIGQSAARQSTDTYMLLSEADPSKSEESTNSSASTPKAVRSTTKVKPKVSPVAAAAPASSNPSPVASVVTSNNPEVAPHPYSQQPRLPAIHIDVQVHISPDTTPDQIDRIFESMAKHLGGFVK